MEITGLLKAKKEVREVSDSFKVREFVLTDNSNEQYPQHIQMQVVQDRCDLLESINIGDKIKVSFNLRGREWTNPNGEVRYFNTIDAWRVEKVGSEQAQPQTQPQQQQAPSDDLPI